MVIKDNLHDNIDSFHRRFDRINRWGWRRNYFLASSDLIRHASLSSHRDRTLHGNIYGGKYYFAVHYLGSVVCVLLNILCCFCCSWNTFGFDFDIKNSQKIRKTFFINFHFGRSINNCCGCHDC